MKKEKVTTAVIPAAGSGTRFFPITRAQPKEMLPVVDKPVIQYVVEEAIASGMDNILIITGRGKRAIEDHFDCSYEIEHRLRERNHIDLLEEYEKLSDLADIHYIRQKEPKGLGDAILLAEKHCSCEPFSVLLGDTITIPNFGEKPCAAQMAESFLITGLPVIAVEEVPIEKIRDYGIIDGIKKSDFEFNITDIIEKPEPEKAPSNLGAIGRYLLTPDIFDLIHDTSKGFGGEIQLTDALRRLPQSIGLITRCRRYDIGDKPGWMKSNFEMILSDPVFGEEMRTYLTNLLKTNNR